MEVGKISGQRPAKGATGVARRLSGSWCCTMVCDVLPCFTLYSVVRCTILWCVVRCCTMLCAAVRYCTLLYNVVRCCTSLYNDVQCHSMLYNTVRRTLLQRAAGCSTGRRRRPFVRSSEAFLIVIWMRGAVNVTARGCCGIVFAVLFDVLRSYTRLIWCFV